MNNFKEITIQLEKYASSDLSEEEIDIACKKFCETLKNKAKERYAIKKKKIKNDLLLKNNFKQQLELRNKIYHQFIWHPIIIGFSNSDLNISIDEYLGNVRLRECFEKYFCGKTIKKESRKRFIHFKILRFDIGYINREFDSKRSMYFDLISDVKDFIRPEYCLEKSKDSLHKFDFGDEPNFENVVLNIAKDDSLFIKNNNKLPETYFKHKLIL